ncbi:Hint domain-containing protein [uncultured Thioclava sp.]|uniref:Hint domain-containing protein n=1 Tax=uncultured Thioclava sp. TaxID=473858 RepID=UPI0025EA0F2B|nr:Hint domain-containing protein [uncultured Thioclava sp.]
MLSLGGSCHGGKGALGLPDGEAGALGRAKHLAASGWGGVRVVQYHHILLPRHAFVQAQGAWVESYWPGAVLHWAL